MERSGLDLIWIAIAEALVFSMQAGFAMVEPGLTRSNNSFNVAIKNLTDFGVSLALFCSIAATIVFSAVRSACASPPTSWEPWRSRASCIPWPGTGPGAAPWAALL